MFFKTCATVARATSGGALAPEPAARDRGRTAGPVDRARFPAIFGTVLEIRRLSDSKSDIKVVRFHIGRLTSNLKKQVGK